MPKKGCVCPLKKFKIAAVILELYSVPLCLVDYTNICHPFELCYTKCRFSTDRIKQRSNVLCLLSSEIRCYFHISIDRIKIQHLLQNFTSNLLLFCFFFCFLAQKKLKMTISASDWGVQHPNAG